MKQSDYNRVISLYKHSNISRRTCVMLIAEICKDIAAIADWVQTLYSDIEELKKEGYHKIIKP